MTFPSTDFGNFKFLCPGKLDLKSQSLLQNLMVGLNNLNKALGNKASFPNGEKYTAY